MPIFSFLDHNSDITDITWRHRQRFAPMDKISEHLMRGKSDLSFSERELIATLVSALNECRFCYGSHQAVAKNFGVEATAIEAITTDLDTAPVSDTIKPILYYVKKLTLTPSKIVESDAQQVFAAGWSEQALQDAICITCLFNFFNRLLDGHGIKGNDNIYEFGANHLSKRGYGVPWFIGLIKPFIKKQKLAMLSR